MTWDPHSNTAGLIVGFGMMLVSGFFLYLEYMSYKKRAKEDAKRRLIRTMFLELILPYSVSKIGFFLFGLLILVLITLQFFGVIH